MIFATSQNRLLPRVLLPLVALAATCFVVFPVAAKAPKLASPPAGFSALFNGKDLTGWCGRGQVNPEDWNQLPAAEEEKRQQLADEDLRKHWRVEKGELVNDGHGVFCTTVADYADFELLLDWKMVEPLTDSGIFLRGCPQIQIWDPENPKEQKNGAQLGSGGLWNNNRGSIGKDPVVKADRPVGQWNTFRIHLVGDRVTAHLNGQLVIDRAVMHNFWNRAKPLPARGPLQLQTHGGEMRFRNVFLREIKQGSAKQSDGKSAAAHTENSSSILSRLRQSSLLKRRLKNVPPAGLCIRLECRPKLMPASGHLR